MHSENKRPHTRIISPQRRILVQAFDRNPLPGFATREELAQSSVLPEDTIYIWFQNRSAGHLSRGRLTAQVQDLLASPGPDRTPGRPCGREHEGALNRLLPLAGAGAVGIDTLRSSELPTLVTESQLPQVAQPSGPGKAQDPTQASNTGPLELLLDQVLDEIQVEDNVPATLVQDGGPGGMMHEGTQDSFLPAAEAVCVRMDARQLTDSLIFCRESQVPQVAQTSGPGQAQSPTQASNTDPLELFLNQLPTKVLVEEQVTGPLDLEDEWEEMDTLPELPLTQEVYQAHLEIL